MLAGFTQKGGERDERHRGLIRPTPVSRAETNDNKEVNRMS
jgi:hypothetical protein